MTFPVLPFAVVLVMICICVISMKIEWDKEAEKRKQLFKEVIMNSICIFGVSISMGSFIGGLQVIGEIF